MALAIACPGGLVPELPVPMKIENPVGRECLKVQKTKTE
jgi:hypothetical protein